MKDDFVVEKAQGKRWNVALEILGDGKPFVYQGIVFSLDKNEKTLSCGITVDAVSPMNITEDMALKEYELAKRIVDELIKSSQDFKTLIANCKIEFSILHDYGTGVVELFSVEDGKVRKISDDYNHRRT